MRDKPHYDALWNYKKFTEETAFNSGFPIVEVKIYKFNHVTSPTKCIPHTVGSRNSHRLQMRKIPKHEIGTLRRPQARSCSCSTMLFLPMIINNLSFPNSSSQHFYPLVSMDYGEQPIQALCLFCLLGVLEKIWWIKKTRQVTVLIKGCNINFYCQRAICKKILKYIFFVQMDFRVEVVKRLVTPVVFAERCSTEQVIIVV